MATETHIFAGVAGYFGRQGQQGLVGTFRRSAQGGEWEQVVPQETFTVAVHPADTNLVFAGTADGVYRSTDRGKTF